MNLEAVLILLCGVKESSITKGKCSKTPQRWFTLHIHTQRKRERERERERERGTGSLDERQGLDMTWMQVERLPVTHRLAATSHARVRIITHAKVHTMVGSEAVLGTPLPLLGLVAEKDRGGTHAEQHVGDL